jgi:hypothetical protein
MVVFSKLIKFVISKEITKKNKMESFSIRNNRISTSTFTNHFTLKFIFVRATLFQHHNITSDP